MLLPVATVIRAGKEIEPARSNMNSGTPATAQGKGEDPYRRRLSYTDRSGRRDRTRRCRIFIARSYAPEETPNTGAISEVGCSN
jgi:hypothetical protein